MMTPSEIFTEKCVPDENRFCDHCDNKTKKGCFLGYLDVMLKIDKTSAKEAIKVFLDYCSGECHTCINWNDEVCTIEEIMLDLHYEEKEE